MLQHSTDHHRAGFKTALPVRLDRRSPLDAERELLDKMMRSLRRNLRLIVMITLIGTGAVTAVTFMLTPQYKAVATVFVDSRKTQLLKDREVVGGPSSDSGAIDSEAELLSSPALLHKVAERLDLINDDEFGRSSGIIGFIYKVTGAVRDFIFGEDEALKKDALARVVKRLDKKVETKRRNQSFVIDLTVWSRDNTKAARIANTLTDVYLEAQIEAKRAAVEKANQWLVQQAEELRKRVEESDRAYEKYKAESGLFDPGGEALSDRQIQQLNESLVDARAKAAEAYSKYEQLKQITPDKLRTAAASSDVLQSTVVSNLRGQYADVARKQAELTTRYGPRHPQVLTNKAELDRLSQQITEEIGRIVASAKNDYEMAKNRQESLEASLEQLKQHAGEFNQKSIKLHELEREAQANRDMYQTILARNRETAAQINMQLPDSRVVSPATAPLTPEFPKKALMIGLGFFGNLGLGIAVALARGTFNPGFSRVGELQSALGLRPLASIPLIGSAPQRPRLVMTRPDRLLPGSIANTQALARYAPPNGSAASRRLTNFILDQPDSVFAESFRSLRFAVKQAASYREMRVVLVTSSLPGEGKSTVSANLARTAAMTGDRVLLIDSDLRRPSLAATLNLARSPGLTGLLSGESDLNASRHFDKRTGLHIIAGTNRVSGSDAISLLSSENMKRLIRGARKKFDLVILDTPPLLPVVDSRLLMDQVDAVILVVASDETGRDAVEAALQETPGLEEKILGVVLNRSTNDFDRYYGNEYR